MKALTLVTQDALRHRREEFLQCCTLIDAATLRLAEETHAREAGPAITELESTFRAIADAEMQALERRLPDLDPGQRELVRRSIRRILKKLLHMPVRALREGGPAEQDVIRRAFSKRREP